MEQVWDNQVDFGTVETYFRVSNVDARNQFHLRSGTSNIAVIAIHDGKWKFDNGTGYYVGDPIPYYDNVYHYYHNYWYPYVNTGTEVRYEKSKVDTAFKIMRVLIEKKIVDDKKLTIGKFISLVNDIAKEL